jgi:hypothetical protein
MISNRRCAFALATVSTIICSIAPANAAQFDGNWSMVAVTTSGHCGQIPIGLGISRGRIYATGGSFASYPIQLGGRVAPSGQVQGSGWPADRSWDRAVQWVSGQRDLGRYRALRSLLGRLERHSLLNHILDTAPGGPS